jgi:hypothetical protein
MYAGLEKGSGQHRLRIFKDTLNRNGILVEKSLQKPHTMKEVTISAVCGG